MHIQTVNLLVIKYASNCRPGITYSKLALVISTQEIGGLVRLWWS
jgi:hypothetical protein